MIRTALEVGAAYQMRDRSLTQPENVLRAVVLDAGRFARRRSGEPVSTVVLPDGTTAEHGGVPSSTGRYIVALIDGRKDPVLLVPADLIRPWAAWEPIRDARIAQRDEDRAMAARAAAGREILARRAHDAGLRSVHLVHDQWNGSQVRMSPSDLAAILERLADAAASDPAAEEAGEAVWSADGAVPPWI